MNERDKIDDLFLKALIKNDGIRTPSNNFTANIMAKIPAREVVIQESSRLFGKNLTLFIFLLVGIINVIVLYFIWPYLSVWIPENSFAMFIIENITIFLRSYISNLVNLSATLSLLFVIIIGSITIFGKDEIVSNVQRFSKRLSL